MNEQLSILKKIPHYQFSLNIAPADVLVEAYRNLPERCGRMDITVIGYKENHLLRVDDNLKHRVSYILSETKEDLIIAIETSTGILMIEYSPVWFDDHDFVEYFIAVCTKRANSIGSVLLSFTCLDKYLQEISTLVSRFIYVEDMEAYFDVSVPDSNISSPDSIETGPKAAIYFYGQQNLFT